MIDHVWTVLCSRAVIDRDTNNISLQNVLERVIIPAEPTPQTLIPERFELVTLLSRAIPNDPCQGRVRVTAVFPSGEIFGEPTEMDIDLSKAERHRHRLHFPGIPTDEAGRHIFKVEIQNDGESDWHLVASIPLTIEFRPPEEEQDDSILE